MKSIVSLGTLFLLLLNLAVTPMTGQTATDNRLRELREKERNSSLTSEEKTEFDRGMEARRAASAERQALTLDQMRQSGQQAFAAAKARPAPTGPAREFFVNNEIGDDGVDGLAPTKRGGGGPVKTLAKGMSLLRAGDTLHLAVTSLPYRESLRLNDRFGGVSGKPIVIDGHGATITGCDPLRLDGWVEAGSPGLYKSAKVRSELDEANDESRLMRVFFMFDGVMQHMGRSSKGDKAGLKVPGELQPGEWTYVESEKTFYIKVAGKLADAKIEAPYRRNGVAIRGDKIAVTDVMIKNLVVCHVLNDGFNLHGAAKGIFLQNIAAYECGDDGISPHETCEVTIDGFWSIGNSTGMGNGYLSVTRASNIHLEGNLGHQFMSAHAAVTELRNAIIIAPAGTQPVNLTNSQGSRLKMDNVQISSPNSQKLLITPDAALDARRLTVVGPGWENRGKVCVTESVISGGKVVCLEGGTWEGSKNVYDPAVTPPSGEKGPVNQSVTANALKTLQPPFPGAGANASEFRIPPRPTPHPGAGRFTSLRSSSS